MRSIHSTWWISREKNKTYWNILLQRNQGIGRLLEPAFKVSNSQQLRQTAFLSSAAPSKLSHTNRSLTLRVYFFYQENRQKKILETGFVLNTSRADCILGVLFCFVLFGLFCVLGVDWLVGWAFWCCFLMSLFLYLTTKTPFAGSTAFIILLLELFTS